MIDYHRVTLCTEKSDYGDTHQEFLWAALNVYTTFSIASIHILCCVLVYDNSVIMWKIKAVAQYSFDIFSCLCKICRIVLRVMFASLINLTNFGRFADKFGVPLYHSYELHTAATKHSSISNDSIITDKDQRKTLHWTLIFIERFLNKY